MELEQLIEKVAQEIDNGEDSNAAGTLREINKVLERAMDGGPVSLRVNMKATTLLFLSEALAEVLEGRK